jgi:WD40 repeat protein
METGNAVRTFKGHTDKVECVSFNADNRYVMSGSWDKTLKLWNVETGETVHTFNGHTAEVFGVSISADSKRAVSSSADKSLILWNLEAFISPPVVPDAPQAASGATVTQASS